MTETQAAPEPLTDALAVLRALDAKHFPTTRAKRPGWEVCDHDSMTWPCDTQKALEAFEPWYAAHQALDAARSTVPDRERLEDHEHDEICDKACPFAREPITTAVVEPGLPCSRFFGSDGTICATHHGHFLSATTARCDKAVMHRLATSPSIEPDTGDTEPTIDRDEFARRVMESLNRHGGTYRLPKDPSDLAHLIADDLLTDTGDKPENEES